MCGERRETLALLDVGKLKYMGPFARSPGFRISCPFRWFMAGKSALRRRPETAYFSNSFLTATPIFSNKNGFLIYAPEPKP